MVGRRYLLPGTGPYLVLFLHSTPIIHLMSFTDDDDDDDDDDDGNSEMWWQVVLSCLMQSPTCISHHNDDGDENMVMVMDIQPSKLELS